MDELSPENDVERVDGYTKEQYRKMRNWFGAVAIASAAGAIGLDVLGGVNLDDGINTIGDVAFLASGITSFCTSLFGIQAAALHKFGFDEEPKEQTQE